MIMELQNTVTGGDNTDMTFEQNGDGNAGMPTDEDDTSESDGFSVDTGAVAVTGVDLSDLIDVENASVFFTGNGQVETINNDQKTDIVITGSNHTVNIESNIGTLSVNGTNSIIRFSANVTVDVCNVAGSDNTAERAENVTLSCLVEGSGNSGFE